MKKMMALIIGFAIFSMTFANGLITPEKLNEIKDNKGVVVIDYRTKEIIETVPGAIGLLNSEMARTIEGTPGMLLSKG